MHSVVRVMEQSTLSPIPASVTTSFSKDTHITADSGSELVSDEEMVKLEPTMVVSKASSITAGQKRGGGETGRFKRSWKLPPYITSNKRESKYAYCKLCSSNFVIGGFNDINYHVEGLRHT